jgi:hypothetical protein
VAVLPRAGSITTPPGALVWLGPFPVSGHEEYDAAEFCARPRRSTDDSAKRVRATAVASGLATRFATTLKDQRGP